MSDDLVSKMRAAVDQVRVATATDDDTPLQASAPEEAEEQSEAAEQEQAEPSDTTGELESKADETEEEAKEEIEIDYAGDALDVGFLGLGFSPKWSRAETPRMPKGRYGIMKIGRAHV